MGLERAPSLASHLRTFFRDWYDIYWRKHLELLRNPLPDWRNLEFTSLRRCPVAVAAMRLRAYKFHLPGPEYDDVYQAPMWLQDTSTIVMR